MHGAGGTANIFGKVKNAISDFIRSTHDGDTVTLYTFDRDTSLRSNIRITGDLDKRDLLKGVSDLSSNGDRTYTGKAIHDALERAVELKGRSDAAERTVSIVLFTDGLEDVRGIPDPVSIPSNISLIPKDQPYMFFVSLGAQEHEKQLESFVKDPAMGNHGEVIRDPGAGRIAEVGDSIRKKIGAPSPPKELNLTVEPRNLDFGQIEPGNTTSSQTVSVHTDSDCSVRVTLGSAVDEGVSIVEPAGQVILKAGQNHPLGIRLKSAAGTTDGLRTFTLAITPESPTPHAVIRTANVEGALNIVRVPFWRKLLKYLVLLMILVAIAIAVLSVIKGEPPWIWLPGLFERTSLEGELQLIQPQPARVEEEFISLTQLRTKRVELGSLIPNGSTQDSDAELRIVTEKGAKSIRLRRARGIVSVNNVEVAETSVYDGDLIELGNTKVRFHWIGHEHPVELDEENLN